MKRQLIYHTHINTSKIEVSIKTENETVSCYLDRVSRDGLTLSCNADTLHTIMPNKASVAPKDPISLSTSFDLGNKINAECRVIFARRLSKDQFIMELKFVEINEKAMLCLDSFIEHSIRTDAHTTEIQNHPTKTKLKKPEVYDMKKGETLNYQKVA